MKSVDRILRNLKRIELEPKFRNRLLIFLALGVFGLLLLGASVIWGSVEAYKSLSTFYVSPKVQSKIDDLKTQAARLHAIDGASCFDKVQSLVSLTPWFTNPASQNLTELKIACLESKVRDCNGSKCDEQLPSVENRKRETI